MAFLRPAYYADSEMDFRVFAASLLCGFGGGFRICKAGLLWGNTAMAEITIGGWAKVIIPGGTCFIAGMKFGPIRGEPKRA